MLNFQDIQKANDPRKIAEAFFGSLGKIYGQPFGIMGDFAQFSPKSYFNLDSYYNTAGAFKLSDYYNAGNYI